MGASNKVTGIINLIGALAGVALVIVGVWLSKQHTTDCVKFLQWPVIVIGAFILLMSVAGFVGACWGVPVLLWIYLFVMFLLIVLLLVFTVFAFVVTNEGAGRVVSDRGYKEYRLQDYSTWLRRFVDGSSNWRKIKSCLQDANVCGGFTQKYDTFDSIANASLSSVQSGCCEPPSECGFSYSGSNTWTRGTSTSANSDCTTWSNNSELLCFNCDSCKAGVLNTVKHDWRVVGGVNVAVLVVLIAVYTIGCYAYKNVRRESFSRGGYGKHGGNF
eukprot:TRINITY_DN7012_c0_g1_i1.p1 TRINITY_DN7012_c0_g1~~TRINITY_DN7012_c0_g1_i1.p1  ORF type:complete len:273 (+),score=23.88 TRINITY_DN7012_c0_g1_i1:232-1050(+)